MTKKYQCRSAVSRCFFFGVILLFFLVVAAEAQKERPLAPSTGSSTGENDPARQEEAKRSISRSIAAYGGEDRLLAITAVSFASQSTGSDGKPIQFKVYFKDNDKFRSEVTGPDFFAMTIANGPSAWMKSDQTLIDLVSGDVEALKISTLIQSQPYALYDRLTKFWAEGERSTGDATYQLIGVSGFLGTDYTRGEIYLDPTTFLIRRFEYEEEVETKQGKGVRKAELRYDNYKTFDGVLLPTVVTTFQGENKSVVTYTEFKINPDLPDNYFDKPKE